MEPMGIQRHRRKARRVSERERTNQSKPKREHVPECPRLTRLEERSRRESNPHLRFRKPLFCPLNYGNNNVERINGFNAVGQDAVAVRSDFRAALLSTNGSSLAMLSEAAHFRDVICLPMLKKRSSWKSRMFYSSTSLVTRSSPLTSNTPK